MAETATLRGISEIRAFFRTNQTPIYFVSPTAFNLLGIEAFAALPDHDWGSFLYDANLAGLPACALPMGVGDEGLPLSLQIIGARGADGAVLAAAQHIEERIHDRAPARRR